VAIANDIDLVTRQMWPQGDIRDPLGTWAARLGVTGDASGGSIKVTCTVPTDERDAHVYTCYDVVWAQLTGTHSTSGFKVRLLTNWPDIDPVPGIQGFSTLNTYQQTTDAEWTAPIAGIFDNATIQPLQRFILLMPRTGTPLGIVEVEQGANVDLATYSFEFYGYYWDRAVLDAPGGPRHPGSN